MFLQSTSSSAPTRIQIASQLRQRLPGKNLYDLAQDYGITVVKDGRLNKGWAGQTIEKVAELEAGNAQRRDGFDFELKSTSLILTAAGWEPKETIKVTQLSPNAILTDTFETSALWNKLASLILVGCHHESESFCRVVKVSTIDVNEPAIVEEIRNFWLEIQHTLCNGEFADYPFEGSSENLVQLRPIGTGKNWSTCPVTGRKFPSRAFYGTKRLIKRIFQL